MDVTIAGNPEPGQCGRWRPARAAGWSYPHHASRCNHRRDTQRPPDRIDTSTRRRASSAPSIVVFPTPTVPGACRPGYLQFEILTREGDGVSPCRISARCKRIPLRSEKIGIALASNGRDLPPGVCRDGGGHGKRRII
jgi:hypothetical protein